jgi:hypothetical protein
MTFISGTGNVRARAAQVSVEGQAMRFSDGFRRGNGDAEDGVRAEFRFVLCAVEFDHRVVKAGLIVGVKAEQFGSDQLVDVLNRFEHALAQVAGFVAVAQLERFVFTGRCARRHGEAAAAATLQNDVDLDRRVAAGVENFTCFDVGDVRHRAC